MIVPVTDEEKWVGQLVGLPTFNLGTTPMVVISPHPDDETLAAGGLIAAHSDRGRDVLVIAVTDGENAYQENAGLRELRAREQEEAVQILGKGRVSIVRLRLEDSGLHKDVQGLERALEPHVSYGTHVIAPWTGDYHPDHETCGQAALEVAKRAGARLSWCFFWTWHRGTPDQLHNLYLHQFRLNTGLQQRKRDALACHRSQLEQANGEPILPESLLAPARRGFEVFASAC